VKAFLAEVNLTGVPFLILARPSSVICSYALKRGVDNGFFIYKHSLPYISSKDQMAHLLRYAVKGLR
jgi:hypothetical protein